MYAENNNAKAFFYSVIVYVLLSLLCLLGVISIPAENQQINNGGVEVNIGTSDQGTGNDITSAEDPSVAERANHHVSTEKTMRHSEKVKTEKFSPPKEIITQNNEEALAFNVNKKSRKTDSSKEFRKALPKPRREILNQNALYKGPAHAGTGQGDGITGRPGNQGKPNGTALSNSYSGTGSGGGGVALNLEGRRFISKPSLSDDGQTEGRISVDISVNRDGEVSTAKAGGRGTTIQNAALWRKCEDAVREAHLNSISEGPEIQTGRVIFTFKLQ